MTRLWWWLHSYALALQLCKLIRTIDLEEFKTHLDGISDREKLTKLHQHVKIMSVALDEEMANCTIDVPSRMTQAKLPFQPVQPTPAASSSSDIAAVGSPPSPLRRHVRSDSVPVDSTEPARLWASRVQQGAAYSPKIHLQCPLGPMGRCSVCARCC